MKNVCSRSTRQLGLLRNSQVTTKEMPGTLGDPQRLRSFFEVPKKSPVPSTLTKNLTFLEKGFLSLPLSWRHKSNIHFCLRPSQTHASQQ